VIAAWLLASALWAAPQTRTISFRDDLGESTDLSLQGLHASTSIVLPIPRAWELTTDPVLQLNYEHSAVLVEHRSNLTVLVNDRAVATQRLGPDTAAGAQLQVPLSRELLQPWNQIKVAVTQHLDARCEDPFDPALWTRVSADSTVAMTYEPVPVEGELLDWPFPILDPQGFGPVRAAFDLPPQPDAAALDAMAQIALSLGRLAGYRGTAFEPEPAGLEAASTAVIQVGLVGDLTPVPGLTLPDLRPGEGLVAIAANPHAPALPVVVVTGADAAGLALATRALISPDRRTLLSGPVSVVRHLGEMAIDRVTDLPRAVPSELARFTLADLGLDDRTVRGFYSPTITIPLRFEGDSHPMEDHAEMFLDFAYGAQVDPLRSRVEVRLNGIPLRAWTLSDRDGSEAQRVRLALPEALLVPASILEVDFLLVPRGQGNCVHIRDRQLWATLYDTTELRVPRDHFAWLPDLSRLQFGFWPYGEDLDDGVVIALPDEPSIHSLSAAANLASHLGRMGPDDPPRVAVVSGPAGTLDQRTERHGILLVDQGSHAARAQLIDRGALATVAKARTLPKGWTGRLQQIRHPWQPDGTVLEIAAPDDRALARLAAAVRHDTLQRQLAETVVVIGSDGQVARYEATPRRRIGSLHAITRFRIASERAYPLVGLGVFLAGLLLAGSLRRWAEVRGGAM